MNSPSFVERLVALAICFLFMMYTVQAQTAPAQRLELGELISDKAGNIKKLHVEFGLTTDFVVARVQLVYRAEGASRWSEVRLKRNVLLRYEADLIPCRSMVYFLRLTPEMGPDTYLGSSEQPFALDTGSLPKVPGSAMSARTKKIIIAGAVAAAILSIFGLARMAGKKP